MDAHWLGPHQVWKKVALVLRGPSQWRVVGVFLLRWKDVDGLRWHEVVVIRLQQWGQSSPVCPSRKIKKNSDRAKVSDRLAGFRGYCERQPVISNPSGEKNFRESGETLRNQNRPIENSQDNSGSDLKEKKREKDPSECRTKKAH